MSSHPSSGKPRGPGRRRRSGAESDARGHAGDSGYGAYGHSAADGHQQAGGYGGYAGHGAYGGGAGQAGSGYSDFGAPFGAGTYPAEPYPGGPRSTEPFTAEPFTAEPFAAGATSAAKSGAMSGATAVHAGGPFDPFDPLEAEDGERQGPHGTAGAARPSRTQALAASRARARRKRRVRNGFLGVGSVAALSVLAVAGLLPDHAHPAATSADAFAAAKPSTGAAKPSTTSAQLAPKPAPGFAQLPGLGASFRAKVPASAGQVLLARGRAANANTVTVVLYTRTAAGTWLPGASWSGHNALDGWTADHHDGDLHSPIGVYSLTDAGGLYANPGTKLPYLRSSEFQDLSTGFEGESLADAFNYVIAINYNHVPGTSPLSPERPMGADKGGGIWVHVDHGGPTHGCISIPQADMVALLKALDPAKHPVIVMGDAASLAA